MLQNGDRVVVNEKYGSYVGERGIVIADNIKVARAGELGHDTLDVFTVLLIDTGTKRIELQATAEKFDKQ